MSFYVTTFCNHAHRLSDGKPLNHNCYVLPPAALQIERDGGDIDKAIALIQAAKPLREHRGVKSPQ